MKTKPEERPELRKRDVYVSEVQTSETVTVSNGGVTSNAFTPPPFLSGHTVERYPVRLALASRALLSSSAPGQECEADTQSSHAGEALNAASLLLLLHEHTTPSREHI